MDLPFPEDSLFLVGIVPSPRDLEIARLLGWYRIPLRFAPKIVEVDYLAFYQTSSFGNEHKWKIEFYAEIRGHELTTRHELFKDEPNHPRAGEEYYKIQLGPVESLPHSIDSGGWKRLTFLYTTGKKILNARELKDLATTYDERELLWTALREKAAKGSNYQVDLPEMVLDPAILAMLGNWENLGSNPNRNQYSSSEASGGTNEPHH